MFEAGVILFWLALSLMVGVFAHVRRSRDGVGWFFLALFISPMLAGILVAILHEGRPRLAGDVSRTQRTFAILAWAIIGLVIYSQYH